MDYKSFWDNQGGKNRRRFWWIVFANGINPTQATADKTKAFVVAVGNLGQCIVPVVNCGREWCVIRLNAFRNETKRAIYGKRVKREFCIFAIM